MAHAGWMIFGLKVHLFASGHSFSYIKEIFFACVFFGSWLVESKLTANNWKGLLGLLIYF